MRNYMPPHTLTLKELLQRELKKNGETTDDIVFESASYLTPTTWYATRYHVYLFEQHSTGAHFYYEAKSRSR